MNELSSEQILDYTDLTCTNLMIKLKIHLKNLSNSYIFQFYANREQVDNIKKPFSKKSYSFEAIKVSNNKFHCKITKQ